MTPRASFKRASVFPAPLFHWPEPTSHARSGAVALHSIELLTAALLGAKLAGELVLSALNRREIARHAGAVPAAFAGTVDQPTYEKSVAYSLAKLRFGDLETIVGALVLAAVVFSGALPWSFAAWTGALGDADWSAALWLIAVMLALAVPGLPFEWWATFRLEAKFGFNQSTLGLWISDKLKGGALGLVIGFPLLWLVLGLVGWTGRWWWLWGVATVTVFQLVMLVAYPKFILPLFNKLTPLEAGALRDDLLALADRTGFAARTIEVMDGSKRSGHSNAFFTGFGRFRRIVLFDTLIAQLDRAELAAVLAHEIGHYKRGHIPKMLALSTAFTVAFFGAIAWLQHEAFATGFGFAPTPSIAPVFLLLALLGGLATFWLSPLLNALSRQHEYEADAFARDATGGSAGIVGALRKLSTKNLSNLTPHPWYSTFHYSHPTLLERERAVTSAAR